MMIDRDWLIAGIDIPIFDYEIVMHNPSILEILTFGEENFFIGLQFLSLDKKDVLMQVDKELSEIDNFKLLMEIINFKDTNKNIDRKLVIKQTLELLFPNYFIYITPVSIVIKNDNQSLLIDSNNFHVLGQAINAVFDLQSEINHSKYDPANKKAAEIARKLEIAEQKRMAAKGIIANKSTGILAKNISIVSVGLGISYKQVSQMTMFQLFDVVKRLAAQMEWDLYIRQNLIGGKPEPVDNWLEKDLYK